MQYGGKNKKKLPQEKTWKKIFLKNSWGVWSLARQLPFIYIYRMYVNEHSTIQPDQPNDRAVL